MQSKADSILESICNIGSGFIISVCVGFVIYPLFGFDVQPVANMTIVFIFTLISFVRSYVWRRYFNKLSIFHHED